MQLRGPELGLQPLGLSLRYDIDGSGTINSTEEFSQMTTNVISKLASMGKVDAAQATSAMNGTLMQDFSHVEWQLADYTALIKQEFNM